MGLTSNPTPHTPPLDDDPVDCLRLIRSRRVGPVTWHRLMAEHGSARAALLALSEVARAAGVENYSPCPPEVARHELAQGRAQAAKLLIWGGPGYPPALGDLPDAPPLLWCLGDPSLLLRPMVALVGARNASSLGLRMARRLAAGLAEAGFVTVSGLARGIDAVVHEASLAQGTVAVQAGGVDVIYPEENASLMAQVARHGCLLSEQPMGLPPQARHFPQRNRIVSGLSRAVVVVEAAARSGSLITARTALDQGREVLAVPGHPFDARATGCNLLLRDGATLVRGPADVLEAIGGPVGGLVSPDAAPASDAAASVARSVASDPVARDPVARESVAGTDCPTRGACLDPESLPGPRPARRPLGDMVAVHGLILARLGPSPLAEDQLIRDLSLPPATVAQHLVSLELDGRVHRAPGGLLSRVD